MKSIIPLILLTQIAFLQAQVGVGTPLPDPSSQLDVVATDKGILIPRVALTHSADVTTIANGNVESMRVFNTTTVADITPGHYYWDGVKWQRLANTDDLLTVVSPSVLIDNGDGTFTHTSSTGMVTTFSANGSLVDNVDGGTITYTDAGGTATIIDLAAIITGNETLTSLVDNNDGTLTYTDEDGVGTTIAKANLIDNGDGTYTFTNNDGSDETITTGANPITTLVDNGDGTFTYTSEDGTVTNFDADGDMVDNTDGTYTYTSAESIVTTIDTTALEPWFGTDDDMGATDNTEDIYQTGDVGINITAIDDSAALQVGGTDQGVLIPNVALTDVTVAAPVAAPAHSLLVYNTDTAGVAPNDVVPGYYYWDSAIPAWVHLATGPDVDLRLVGNNNHITVDAGVGSNGIDAGTGTGNIAIGLDTGRALTTGNANVILGANGTGSSLDTGASNVLIGDNAGTSITNSNGNVMIGLNAGENATANGFNVFIGREVGRNASTSSFGYNTIIGPQSYRSNLDGNSNAMVGNNTYGSGTTGSQNALMGSNIMQGSSGSNNAILGQGAASNSLGSINNNVLIGRLAGSHLQNNANNNIFIGYLSSSLDFVTGTHNLLLGNEITLQNIAASNQMSIGNLIFSEGIDGTGTTVSSGNIGIGTPTPSQRLDIAGGDVQFEDYPNTRDDSGTTAVANLLYTDATGNVLSAAASSVVAEPWFGTDDNMGATDNTEDIYQTGDVGINTTTIDDSAALQVGGTDQGVLLPQVALTSLTDETTTVAAPADGLTVFVPTGSGIAQGYYYWDDANTTWVKLIDQEADLRLVGTNNHITIDAGVGGTGTDAGTGSDNILIGAAAGNALTTSSGIVAIGSNALSSNTTGANNVGIGVLALNLNTTGTRNIAVGSNALSTNTTGSFNSAFGHSALRNNTIGTNNVAMGHTALNQNTTGISNTALGQSSLQNNTTGQQNTAVGTGALKNATTSNLNIAIGSQTLGNLTNGNANIALGERTGLDLISGSNNLLIGHDIQPQNTTASNQLSIGNLIFSDGNDGTLTTVSTGNIGIGEVAPTDKLDVAGTARVQTLPATDADDVIVVADEVTGQLRNGGTLSTLVSEPWFDQANIGVGATLNTQDIYTMGKVGIGTNNSNANLTLFNDDTGGDIGSNLFVENNGTGLQAGSFIKLEAQNGDGIGDQRLFIGTNGLSRTTNILGSPAAGSATIVANGVNGLKIGTSMAAPLILSTNSTHQVQLDANGDLQFIQYPNTRDDSGTTAVANLLYTDATGNVLSAAASSAVAEPWFGTDDDMGATLNTEDIYQMGNVGIGTTTPGYPLEVASSTGSVDIAINSAATSDAGLRYFADGALKWLFENDGDGSVAQPDSFYFGSGLGPVMILEQTGNVGIGEIAPTDRLDIAGTVRVRTLPAIDANDVVVMADETTGQLRQVPASTFDADLRVVGTNNHITIDAGVGSNGTDAGTGSDNILIGRGSGNTLTTGSNNVAVGVSTLQNNTTGANNVAIGRFAMQNTTTASNNTGVGVNALRNNTTGTANSAFGGSSLVNNITGTRNTAIGERTITANTTGVDNTALGSAALRDNITGSSNVAIGRNALDVNTAGSSNISIGSFSLTNSLGDNNIAIGERVGDNITTGSHNLLLGYLIDAQNATASNQMSIGNLIFSEGIDGTGTTISSGNIGIGTPTPSQRLDIAGGDVQFEDYPNTRDDSGVTPVANLLYTDVNGNVLSAAASSAVAEPWFGTDDNMGATDNTEDIYQTGDVGINTTTIDDSAALQVGGNDQGVLLPQVALTSLTDETTTVAAPADRLTVFVPTGSGIAQGYYYWDDANTTWVKLIEANDVDLRFVGSNNHITQDAGVGGTGTDAGTGENNIAIGQDALASNTSGSNFIAMGKNALASNTTGVDNLALGRNALRFNTAGNYNSALSNFALVRNTTGNNNMALGQAALLNNTTGSSNTAVGQSALQNSVTGNQNVAIGTSALKGNVTGNFNIGIGTLSLLNIANGDGNIAIGERTGENLTSGSKNLLLGFFIDAPNPTGSNQMSIGNLIFSEGIDGTGTTISTGNIGIGTTTPTQKLEVAGQIQTAGALYPDYVLEKYVNGYSKTNNEYTFKTLEEVEVYIKENKHLPGVTSINELKKTEAGYSFNITELSAQTLEKVEELFLHTITQQKELEAVKAENKTKNAEIKKLRTENEAVKKRLAKIEAALGIED